MTQSIYVDIYELIQTFPDVVAIVEQSVHPLRLPQQATIPAIVQKKISHPGRYTNSGRTNATAPIVQLTCWAIHHEDAENLADTLEHYLDGYRGEMGSRCAGAVFRTNRVDFLDPETNMAAQIIDFRFCLE